VAFSSLIKENKIKYGIIPGHTVISVIQMPVPVQYNMSNVQFHLDFIIMNIFSGFVSPAFISMAEVELFNKRILSLDFIDLITVTGQVLDFTRSSLFNRHDEVHS
jgi:hypothetical protein